MKKLTLVVLVLLMVMSTACAEGSIADILPEGEKPTLHILQLYANADYNTYPTASVIKEYTGYNVVYDMLPSTDAMDKLNMIMATQEDYDIIIAGSVDLVMNYARSGALMDLTEWLPYAPRLNAALTDYERNTFSIEGHLYAIGMQTPAFNGRGCISSCIFVRQDYLDAMNLSMPETLDDFTNMLRAFKDYANSTGNATIPLTMSSSNIMLPSVAGAFGVSNDWSTNDDGTIINRVMDPAMKEYLSYMKSLYKEGLIDVEFPANTSANVFQKWATGEAACALLNYWDCDSYGDTMIEMQPDAQIGYLAPFTGENGQIGIGYKTGGMDRIAFIPAWCKNIEHVINFIELKLDTEAFVDITIGSEGIHWYYNEDGERWPILPTFTQERGNSVNYYTGRPAELYAELWMLRVKKRPEYWDAWSAMNQTAAFTDYAVVSFAGYAPSFESSIYTSALEEIFQNGCMKIIAGDKDIDYYDTVVNEWLSQGGQALIDDYSAWWSENYTNFCNE